MLNDPKKFTNRLIVIFYILIGFFAIIGLIAFFAWLELLISGEYTAMLKKVAFVVGRAITTILVCVFLGLTIFVWFKKSRNRVVLPDPAPVPNRKPLPAGRSEQEYIKEIRKRSAGMSYNLLEEIKQDYPHYKTLKMAIVNLQRFWTRDEKALRRDRDKSKQEIQQLEKNPYPLQVEIA